MCGSPADSASPGTRYPRPISNLTPRLLVLATFAVLLVGCGGGGGGGPSSATSVPSGGAASVPTGGKGANGISVGNCLNDQDFLVQPNERSVDGQSPAGVSFTLTFYKDAAAATAVAAKKSPKTTALVDNGVVDFKGNPSPYAGAPPAKISKVELAAIRACIDSTNKG